MRLFSKKPKTLDSTSALKAIEEALKPLTQIVQALELAGQNAREKIIDNNDTILALEMQQEMLTSENTALKNTISATEQIKDKLKELIKG